MCLSLILDLSPLSALLLGSRFVEILTQPTWAMILGKSRKQNPPKKILSKKTRETKSASTQIWISTLLPAVFDFLCPLYLDPMVEAGGVRGALI